jgi:threonyl-tRNA synthetase
MLVVGDREAQSGQVSVRHRKHGDQGAKPVAEFIADVQKQVESKTTAE